MPTSRPPYASEYRQKIIDLVRKGRTPEELARLFEPSAQAIRNWVRQAEGIGDMNDLRRRRPVFVRQLRAHWERL